MTVSSRVYYIFVKRKKSNRRLYRSHEIALFILGSEKSKSNRIIYFSVQRMRAEENEKNEEWNRLMNGNARAAESYQRELDRRRA